MKPDSSDLIFLISTVLAAIGLSVIIYSRNRENYNSRVFLLILLLVVGYIISHGIHFLVMTTGDVTVLDRSCHSFLLLIVMTLTFFAMNFPEQRKVGYVRASMILVPSVAVLVLLWSGLLVRQSHAHMHHFMPSFTPLYPVYLLWYVFLIGYSAFVLVRRFYTEKSPQMKMQIITFLLGLIITNLASFLFGVFIPWIMGFYYLVEISPLAFLVGVIMFTAVAVGRFNMFPKALDRVRNFSINRKILLIALVLVPIIIMLIQIPLGRAIFSIEQQEWMNYFVLSLLGGLIVSVSMAVLINMIISYPLKEMKTKAFEIKQGNYRVKLKLKSNDELGELAEAFNDMARTLYQNSSELREKEERITLLLNAFEKSRASIAVVDKNARVLEANKTFMELLGKDPSEILGRDIIELQFKKLDQDELQGIINALTNRTNFETEFAFTDFRGDRKDMLVTVSPVYFGKTGYSGHMFVEVDITERKSLERKLIKAEKLSALGEMSAVLAHEIKTPLTSIKMNADILSEGLSLSEEDRESFQIIQKEIKRLNSLVKEVLQLSRQPELNCTRFDIAGLIENVKRLFQVKAEEKSVLIMNGVESLEVFADQDKLRQVFLNLLENSLESIGSNGRITVSSEQNEGYLKIVIVDTGQGISSAERIFDPFVTTKASGTGLGLSISQKIIEQHGGTLKLINPNAGETAFEIILPTGI